MSGAFDSTESSSWRASCDRTLARHRMPVILAIVALSVAIRVGYFTELGQGACSVTQRYENSDMRFFDDWAHAVAGGDWLGRQPLHPYHDWHRQVAEIRLGDRTQPGEIDPGQARALWNDWYGGTRFHQEPLYPYAVGAVYRLLGDSPRLIQLLQMLLGVLSNLLIYAITRRAFGETAGVVAAALAVACSPLLFYESLLLRATAIGCAGLLVVWLTGEALERESPWRLVIAGLACGLAALLKSTLILLGLGAVLLLLWRERPLGRQALGRAGLLLAGMAIWLVPLVARNVAVKAPAFSLSSVAAVTFIGSHAHGHDPYLGFQLQLDTTADILGRTGGRLVPTVVETLGTHPHAGSWVALQLRKLGAAWHAYEIPNNTNYYLCRLESRVLRVLPATFAWIGPLALAGLFASIFSRRYAPMLYLLLGAHLLPLLAFYVLSRFRAPMIAAAIPFAAAALVFGVEWWVERRRAWLLSLVGVAILATLLVNRPLDGREAAPIRMQDVATAVRYWYLPASRQARTDGDPQQAAAILEKSLALEPPFVAELLDGRPLERPGQLEYLRAFRDLHLETATAMRAAGRDDEARRLLERARALERRAHELDSSGAGPSTP